MNRLLLLLLTLFFAAPASAGNTPGVVYVAVASNFSAVMQQIARRYQAHSGQQVKISSSATGKHYAQIRQGAPFDVFFAADSKRPQLLEQQGLATGRYSYALGKLLLWSPDPELITGDSRVLSNGAFHYLAIANPKLAPYGRAARQVLQRLGLWERLRSRMVRGENIGQAFQFVNSGNAELGFVAAAQLVKSGQKISGSHWEIPDGWYDEIRQQAVMLNDKPSTRAFFEFVQSAAIRRLIGQSGYRTL